jgi:hypothetical protein
MCVSNRVFAIEPAGSSQDGQETPRQRGGQEKIVRRSERWIIAASQLETPIPGWSYGRRAPTGVRFSKGFLRVPERGSMQPPAMSPAQVMFTSNTAAVQHGFQPGVPSDEIDVPVRPAGATGVMSDARPQPAEDRLRHTRCLVNPAWSCASLAPLLPASCRLLAVAVAVTDSRRIVVDLNDPASPILLANMRISS